MIDAFYLLLILGYCLNAITVIKTFRGSWILVQDNPDLAEQIDYSVIALMVCSSVVPFSVWLILNLTTPEDNDPDNPLNKDNGEDG